ncbi:hypothetical protein H6761_02045 [Candidatus Nomurabacteria bacterium]|nr:hypothetical protein [Candidatus Nomurabacteria bacterium]
MKNILIGTGNPYKRNFLIEIVKDYFDPIDLENNLEFEESGENFLEIAENKAIFYSRQVKGLAISTDGGAVIPALDDWNPLTTKRFAETDQERIDKLLELMKNKTDRRLEWHEALAVADNGELLFSSLQRAMDAKIAKVYNPKFYRSGIWLCSVCEFPKFSSRNYFELNPQEKRETEDSWDKLKQDFANFAEKYRK